MLFPGILHHILAIAPISRVGFPLLVIGASVSVSIGAMIEFVIRRHLVFRIICSVMALGWRYESAMDFVIGRAKGGRLTILVFIVGIKFFVGVAVFLEIGFPQRLIFFGNNNVANVVVGRILGVKGEGNNRIFGSGLPQSLACISAVVPSFK